MLARLWGPLMGLHVADLLRNLAVVVQAGRPVTGALSTLARHHYDPAMRQRLLFVRNEVEQGADLWQAMQNAGLIGATDHQLLTSAQVAGNQVWALNHLAQRMSSRARRRLQFSLEVARPALLIGVGAVVGFVVVSMFTPLIALIHSLV